MYEKLTQNMEFSRVYILVSFRSQNVVDEKLRVSFRVRHQWRGSQGDRGGGGHRLPSENFLEALKSKGGAKIRNCQCEISYKICKVQLVNRFKVVVILALL